MVYGGNKIMIDLIELMAEDEKCAFDQPCKYGYRIENHAVYCHNKNWPGAPRKCHRSWYWKEYKKDQKDSDYHCPGFEANPDYTEID